MSLVSTIVQQVNHLFVLFMLSFQCNVISVTYTCLAQVLVMTAQILLNILRHSIIKMDAIHLLILDECHHAVKKHPYSLVMSEFYHTTPKDKRPVVFGMTASPVNLKGRLCCPLRVSLLFHVLMYIFFGISCHIFCLTTPLPSIICMFF